MKKIITLSLFSLCISINAFSVVRTSAHSGSWTTASTWTPAGVPTTADNLTILAGHTITVTTQGLGNNIVCNGTIQWLANVFIQCYGNYTLSITGLEKGTGQIAFGGSGTLLTVTGTTVGTVRYYFNSSRTISASSVISKLSSTTQIGTGRIVTNLGNFTMGGSLSAATGKWINGAGSTLTLTVNGFMGAVNTGLFDPSPAGNTVILSYTSGNVPKTMAGSHYANLIISGGSGVKSLLENEVLSGTLTINAGPTLSANNFNLSVGGNWIKNGTFTASAGHSVIFNGTVAQTIAGVGSTTFQQLTINNTSSGVSITSGSYLLNQVLTMTNGNFNTNGNPFEMISTAAQTARIAPVAVTASISGNFIIDRFITARDTTWCDLSSPVQSTTFMDWDNELPAISYIYNPPYQYNSILTWNEPSNGFVPVTTSGYALTPGVGFEVYLSNDFVYSSIPNLTMNSIGVPNYGDKNFTSLISYTNPYSAGSSNLVGNPFASNISWSAVLAASTHLDPTIDMFDWTAGAYTTYAAGTEIGSTQGFWVYTLSSAATFHIPESAKTATANSSLKSVVVEPYLTLRLSSNDAGNTFFHVMKVGTSSDATDGFDPGQDHWFRKSPMKSAPEIYSTIDGNKSVINVFNANDNSYDMPLTTTVGVSGYYKIDAAGFNFLNDFTCVELEDKLLNKMVDLVASPSYLFRMNTSDDASRFVIHFSKAGNCKSLNSTNNSAFTFENQVEVLPTSQGNSINFNLTETTPTAINVTNLLGQSIMEPMNVAAFNQSVNVSLPEGFSGMYLIKIESSKGTVIKKFVKK